MLTNEQIGFFNEFGFLVFRQLFSLEEIETIGNEAEVALDEIYQGREGGPQGSWVSLLGPSTPFNASLLEDERFYGIATQLFDENVIGLNTDMLWWQANTGWHRDLDVPGNTGLKFIYYLEALQAKNGALRVVPGSHIEPHYTNVPEVEPLRLTPQDEDYMQKVRTLEIQPGDSMLASVAVESEPGDVIAFAMPLLHASFGGAPNRRFGATVYWAPSKTREQANARRKEARTIHSNHYRMSTPLTHPSVTHTGSKVLKETLCASVGLSVCVIWSGLALHEYHQSKSKCYKDGFVVATLVALSVQSITYGTRPSNNHIPFLRGGVLRRT